MTNLSEKIVKKLNNVDDLSYNERQQLIKDIQNETGIVYGYVNSRNNAINCETHQNLVHNLSVGSAMGFKTKLVIISDWEDKDESI